MSLNGPSWHTAPWGGTAPSVFFWGLSGPCAEPILVFRWQERDGPTVAPPKQLGFGTTVLKTVIGGGDVAPRIEYAPEGVCYSLDVSLSTVAAKAGDETTWEQRPSPRSKRGDR